MVNFFINVGPHNGRKKEEGMLQKHSVLGLKETFVAETVFAPGGKSNFFIFKFPLKLFTNIFLSHQMFPVGRNWRIFTETTCFRGNVSLSLRTQRQPEILET